MYYDYTMKYMQRQGPHSLWLSGGNFETKNDHRLATGGFKNFYLYLASALIISLRTIAVDISSAITVAIDSKTILWALLVVRSMSPKFQVEERSIGPTILASTFRIHG